jgi:hypothetical protein
MEWEFYFDARDYRIAAGAWVLEVMTPDDATWVAATALQRGEDSEAIREVAGLFSPTRRDDGERIHQMFNDLGAGVPTATTAIRWYLPCLLTRICGGDENEFGAVMWHVWELYLTLREEVLEVDLQWKRLETAMYEWEYLCDMIAEVGNERLWQARSKLVADTQTWACKVLEDIGLSKDGVEPRP